MKKVILDDKYELGGGLGSWAKSLETITVTKGDVRLIGGLLMYAYTIVPASFFNFKEGRDVVNWVPIDYEFNTFDNLHKWINSL